MKKFFVFFIFYFFFSFNCYSNNFIDKKNYTLSGIDKNDFFYKFIIEKYFYKKINYKEINLIIKNLYNLGYFKDIKVYKINDKFNFKFFKKNIISNIIVENTNDFSNRFFLSLLDKFNIKKGYFLNELNLLKFNKKIILLYSSIGKYNVSLKVDKIFIKNSVILKLIINEGNYLNLKYIFLNGIDKSDKKNILYLLDKNLNKNFLVFFKRNNFNLYKIIDFFKYVKFFYISNGYLDFKVEKIYFKFLNDKNIKLFVFINKGFKYLIKDIVINNNYKYKNIVDKIKNLYINNNNDFNLLKISEIYKTIELYFRKKGYYDIKINFYIKKYENNLIKIYFDLNLGKIFYVRKIIFNGNKYLKFNFLIDKIPKFKNFILNENLVRKGVVNLLNLGFLDNVLVDIKKNNFSNKVDVIYNIKEIKNNGILNFNLGYDIKHGIEYNLFLSKNNLYYLGDKFIIKGLKNNLTNNSYLSYVYPYNYKDIFIDNNFFFNFKKKNKNYNNISLRNNWGFENNIIFYLNKYLNIKLGLNFKNNSLFNIESKQLSLNMYLKYLNNNLNIKKKIVKEYILNDLLLVSNLLINKLDNNLFHNSGFYLNINNKITIPGFSNFYYKNTFSFLKYIPLFNNKDWILFFDFFNGYGNSLYNGKFPFYENFFSNESNFIRGLNIDSIGPKNIYLNCISSNSCKYNEPSGGNFINSFNTELIVPFNNILNTNYLKKIRSSIFLDTGFILDTNLKKIKDITNYDTNLNSIKNMYKISVGLSFKINTPLGILNISFGYPLKKINNDQLNIVQFSIKNDL